MIIGDDACFLISIRKVVVSRAHVMVDATSRDLTHAQVEICRRVIQQTRVAKSIYQKKKKIK